MILDFAWTDQIAGYYQLWEEDLPNGWQIMLLKYGPGISAAEYLRNIFK